MKVALAQIEPVFSNWKKSFDKHQSFVGKAIDEKADLIVFPEMSLTGYNLKDLTPDLCVDPSGEKLEDVLQLSMQIDVVVSYPEIDNRYRRYISAAYCSKGEIVAVHRKVFLPINGMFNDSKDFIPGNTFQTFKIDDINMGLLICRDMWHEEAVTALVKKGVQCLLVCANIPLRDIKNNGPTIDPFIERTIKGYAEKNDIYVVYVNRVGFEEGTCFYGGSMLVDPTGNVLCKLPFLDEEIGYAIVDLNSIRKKIRSFPLHFDRKDKLIGKVFLEDENEGIR